MKDPKKQRFRNYAWALAWSMIPVILWGAFVRISKSGAGCGEHWPTCNGEVIPLEASAETAIEFVHRLMSGGLGLGVLVLVVWAWRLYPRTDRVRKAALATFVFVITEGAIGAALVLFGLVGDDPRPIRGLVIALHLVNTLGLVACSVITAHFAGGGLPLRWKNREPSTWLLGSSMILLILVSATGAVTALGDTLFPIELQVDGGLMAHIETELSSGQHFLVRLRIVHPILAVATALFLLYMANGFNSPKARVAVRYWSVRVSILVCIQVGIGLGNIALGAPTWMQLLHLTVADLLWIAFVMLAAHALGGVQRDAEVVVPIHAP
jgi:heme A synthase